VLDQWRAVYVLVVILLIAGVFSATRLAEQIYPTMTFSRVIVIATSGDLAPALVQASISRPIEQQLATVLGVQQMTANSTQGTASIQVTFDPSVADINVALQRVSTALTAVQPSLPRDVNVTIMQVDPSLFPVLGYGLSSKTQSSMSLRELALYQIRPQLLGLPGVSLVNVLAGDVREYLISLDPQRLARYGITVDQVTSAIAQTNTIMSIGNSDNHYVRSTILASGQAHNATDLANIAIASKSGVPVTVGMVAGAVESPAPPLWSGSVNDRNAVIVNVFAQKGANFVSIARVVSGAMRKIEQAQHGVTITSFWNQATLVSDAIGSLRDAILIGLALSTLVLFFFLRNWTTTIVAALVIPLAIIMTFAFMGPLQQYLNLMTLGGLAIGVGLIIDDAIVVVENVFRHFSEGERGREAVERAIAEIAAPMTSSTVTTIVVFAPLSLLSGVAGAFFTALATTLAVALLISLILALLFTPNVALQFLRVQHKKRNRLVEALDRRYEPLLRWALRRRVIILAGAGIVLALTAFLGTRLGTDFLPALDEGAFETTYMLPPGTTLAETQRVAAQMEDIIRHDPAVASEADVIGLTMTIEDTPGGVNTGVIRATLKPRNQRAPIGVVINRIQDKIAEAAPGVQLSTKQLLADMLDALQNSLAPIEIRVFGPQQTTLVPIAIDIANRISGVPGVSGAFSGAVFHNPSVVIRPDATTGSFGLSAAQLATNESVAYGGSVVSNVIQNPLTIPVRVRYDLPLYPSIAQLSEVPIVTTSGVQPISRLATIVQGAPQSEINELNQRQYLAVTAQVNGSNLGSIVSGIKQKLAGLTLPPGYSYEIAGAYQSQTQSFQQFALALALSVALVFLVMVLQFRSFLQPLAIVLTVPLALFGAVLLLFLTRISLNVSSLMGVILLVGLVVKNGILLLEYAHRRQEQGDSVTEALVYAGRVRLRPILMTTLTALLGMLPLAFALGSGSELLQPLAIAVIGGLTFSTLFTLIIIPVVYDLLFIVTHRKIPPPHERVEQQAEPVHA